jgi:hypothetical protein
MIPVHFCHRPFPEPFRVRIGPSPDSVGWGQDSMMVSLAGYAAAVRAGIACDRNAGPRFIA